MTVCTFLQQGASAISTCATALSIQNPDILTEASYNLQLACVKISGSYIDSERTYCTCSLQYVHFDFGAKMCIHIKLDYMYE